MTSQQFPAGFLWGSGASAYQVEGAWDADGKGPSIWDTSTHSGRWATPDGTSGDVAIDQYNRLDEDLDLARSLGAPMHRFSISWPRVLPTGEGTVNPAGLDYYERMVDGLAARGIQSAVNLFHWDLPQSLEDQGGWMNRDTAYRFADFSHIVAARLGDRVAQWWTINEPLNPSLGGYMAGALPRIVHSASMDSPRCTMCCSLTASRCEPFAMQE
ncbi:glycoside hydrolase family 1 protein [Humidisolicoccus flavus]|uniref:glycoside hydrolase family 1 protein n=1 Tax=Humidisolicoccus flavus TaxID=3111414 RepID=UPI0032460180